MRPEIAWLLGLVAGAIITLFARRPRVARTDEEHADRCAERASELNMAMHNARSVGLAPQVKISPLDDEVPPFARPFRVTVERDGKLVERV